MQLRLASLEGFLRRPDPAVRALLIYGSDTGEVADAARRVVAAFAAGSKQGLDVVEIDDRSLAANPARLADEVQSLSLLGGRRLVRLRDADTNAAKALRGVLDAEVTGDFVLAEAGSLNKSSALRALFEDHPRAAVLALHEATDDSAAAAVNTVLRPAGLSIAPDALTRLIELAGLSSSFLRQEAEKLALFCHGTPSVTLADVEAICGGGAEPAVEELVLHTFDGDLDALETQLSALLAGGEDAGRLLGAAHQHGIRLAELRQAVDRGTAPEQAARSARPPIFFKILQTVISQVRYWPLEPLLAATTTLSGAIRDCRLNAPLAPDVASRTLLATARKARSLRAQRI